MQNYQREFIDAIFENNDAHFKNMSVYSANYIGRIIGALKITYPATVKLVGEDFFEYFASKFALAHVPKKSHLCGYGFGFIKYLANLKQTSHLVYLKELMYLEFIVEKTTSTLKCIREIGQDSIYENVILRLREDANLIAVKHNVCEIYRFCKGEITNADVKRGEEYYIVFREDLKPEVMKIEKNIYKIAKLFNKNKKLTLDAIFPLLDMEGGEISKSFAYLLQNNLLRCDDDKRHG